MNKFETTKLFYNEYANKLVIRNQLAHLFREKNWSYAKENLDKLQHDIEMHRPLEYRRGWRVEPIDFSNLQEAQVIFNTLSKAKDVKIRVEHPRMQVYSNNETLLKTLANKLSGATEFWAPGKNTLIPSDTIVLKKYQPYEYRVTLGSYTNPEFASWVENNSDKVKIGETCLRAIQSNSYTRGLYFYVKNERVLSLLQLIIGGDIQTVHKVIYK